MTALSQISHRKLGKNLYDFENNRTKQNSENNNKKPKQYRKHVSMTAVIPLYFESNICITAQIL